MPFLFPSFFVREYAERESQQCGLVLWHIETEKSKERFGTLGKRLYLCPQKTKIERIWKQEDQMYQPEEGSPRLGEQQ